MTPRHLFMASALVVITAVSGRLTANPPPFLPFLPLPFLPGRELIAIGGALAILTTWRPRAGCLAVGASLLYSVLSSRVGFHNHVVLASFLFVLLAIGETWALKAQVPLMYFGAAVSKIAEPDWWTGAFFTAFARQWHHATPSPVAAKVACVTAIAIELILPILLYRAPRIGITLGVIFHTALTAYTRSTFGFYYEVVLVSYLPFFPPLKPRSSRVGQAPRSLASA